MLSPIVTRAERHDFFWPVNYHGTQNILHWMEKNGADRLVHFTTDMIYGHSVTVPQDETHPAKPLGEYGESKLATERLAEEYRAKGFRIPIFRPRLIIGPGRLGILVKLFRLIDMNLPVPMIGGGNNLLVKDRGVRGVVLRLEGCLGRAEFHGEAHSENGAWDSESLRREFGTRGKEAP